MDKQTILKELEFVQKRIEEIEYEVMNTGPEEKGYIQICEAYNKWVDRYNSLIDLLKEVDENAKDKLSKKDKIEFCFRGLEVGGKIVVTISIGLILFAVAELSYRHDENLDLCNGRVFGIGKDLLKLIKL